MAKAMAKVPNGYIHTSHGFAADDMKRPMPTLSDSIFCPAPTGWWHPDSFRFSEAIETGCFPLVDGKPESYDYKIKYYWKGVAAYYGIEKELDRFIVHVDSWDTIPKYIAEEMSNMDKLERKRASMVLWWKAWKLSLMKKIAIRLGKELGREQQVRWQR